MWKGQRAWLVLNLAGKMRSCMEFNDDCGKRVIFGPIAHAQGTAQDRVVHLFGEVLMPHCREASFGFSPSSRCLEDASGSDGECYLKFGSPPEWIGQNKSDLFVYH